MSGLRIEQGTLDSLGGNIAFAQFVAAYKAARIAHEKTEGVPAPVAANSLVRQVVVDYNGEFETYVAQGDTPPPVPDDPRMAALRTDQGRLDLLMKLKSATPADIDAWLATNMTNLAQARAVVGALVKLIATNINVNR